MVFIEESSFDNCKNLRIVDIEGEGLEVIGAYAFSDSRSLKKINLPESVTDIDEGAFFETQIERFYVGKNVVNLSRGSFENEDLPLYSIGSESTVSIEVHPDNPVFCSIDGMLYSKDQKTLYACPGGILRDISTDKIIVDSSGLNVPPVSLSNVPGAAELIVPLIAETNVPGLSL